MSEWERRGKERKGKERRKVFDVRSAHPARGTRDAIESERERRTIHDWIWLLPLEKFNQRLIYIKKKTWKVVKFSVEKKRRMFDEYQTIIFRRNLFWKGIRLSTRAEFWSFEKERRKNDKNLVDFLCHPPSSKVSSYYVSDTRISPTNRPAKASLETFLFPNNNKLTKKKISNNIK